MLVQLRISRHRRRRAAQNRPAVDVLIRCDSHYGRPEAMAWCERNRVGYIFGLAGNRVPLRQVASLAEQAALARLDDPAAKCRRYGDLRYTGVGWKGEATDHARGLSA